MFDLELSFGFPFASSFVGPSLTSLPLSLHLLAGSHRSLVGLRVRRKSRSGDLMGDAAAVAKPKETDKFEGITSSSGVGSCCWAASSAGDASAFLHTSIKCPLMPQCLHV